MKDKTSRGSYGKREDVQEVTKGNSYGESFGGGVASPCRGRSQGSVSVGEGGVHLYRRTNRGPRVLYEGMEESGVGVAPVGQK